jgi:hypothetical protein
VALLLAGAAAGCQSAADFSVKYASGFEPARHKVSVFGVFKDGRMSSEAWGGLAPRISAALGGGPCDAGYGGAAFPPDAPVSAAIDEYVTSSGPTDDLLGQIAPAATGDLVLVLTVAGQLPLQKKISVQTAPPVYSKRGRRSRDDRDPNALDVAAQLFSVEKGQSVAVVSLEYAGDSIDEAMTKFASQLGQLLPGAACAGWNAAAKLDADRIRGLGH